ncbi:MAG: hypothetical protein K9L62_16305 [Vallitaleaceae bacterium]|nr:hypothetical protein [Vallitaleaceae bacterium]
MNFYIVTQTPGLGYDDKEGVQYDYPVSIPDGKQIRIWDVLISNLTKKKARKLGNENQRLTGFAIIEDIKLKMNDNRRFAITRYFTYKKFEPRLTFKDIGGDPRSNQTNSINMINIHRIIDILLYILFKM